MEYCLKRLLSSLKAGTGKKAEEWFPMKLLIRLLFVNDGFLNIIIINMDDHCAIRVVIICR